MDKIGLAFDTPNMIAYIKELLNTESNNILMHASFEHQLSIKALGNQKEVRRKVLEWLEVKVIAEQDKEEVKNG